MSDAALERHGERAEPLADLWRKHSAQMDYQPRHERTEP